METIELETHLGDLIENLYRKARRIAMEQPDKLVHFLANGINFYADKDSTYDLVEKYLDSCFRYGVTEIGPTEPNWSQEFIDQKEKEYKETQEQLKKHWEEVRQSEEDDFQKFLELTKDTIPELNDKYYFEDIYDLNLKDLYSKTAIEYAVSLMKYLQYIYNTNGTITEQDINDGEYLIRKYGITGFQHAFVVSVISKNWKYHELYEEVNKYK